MISCAVELWMRAVKMIYKFDIFTFFLTKMLHFLFLHVWFDLILHICPSTRGTELSLPYTCDPLVLSHRDLV